MLVSWFGKMPGYPDVPVSDEPAVNVGNGSNKHVALQAQNGDISCGRIENCYGRDRLSGALSANASSFDLKVSNWEKLQWSEIELDCCRECLSGQGRENG